MSAHRLDPAGGDDVMYQSRPKIKSSNITYVTNAAKVAGTTKRQKKIGEPILPKAQKKHKPVAIDPSDFIEQKMFDQLMK